MPTPYVMAVDDEPDVLGTLSRILGREGYEVGQATSGSQAWQKIEYPGPDLLILDVMMPDMDGLTLCRQLRADSRFIALPILLLTARTTIDDVVSGLDAGGDDYVRKPFEVAELTARVRALLRVDQTGQGQNAVIALGDLKLDSDTYQVQIDQRSIQLTSTEHRLLRYLMEHPNQALSPQRLLEAVWDYPPNIGDPDLVRAHVRNLRAKLEQGEASKQVLRTVHGVGYLIAL